MCWDCCLAKVGTKVGLDLMGTLGIFTEKKRNALLSCILSMGIRPRSVLLQTEHGKRYKAMFYRIVSMTVSGLMTQWNVRS